MKVTHVGSDLALRMASRLTQLERDSHLREFSPVRSINLCSNDYLGLATDSRLRTSVVRGIELAQKVGSTGSRLLSGHDCAWELLEEQFATFAGTEASLFFNSGYAANTGLFAALLEPGDMVFSDALNHASIIDGVRLSRAHKMIYRHCDLDALANALRSHSYRHGARVIVTESIFSMGGDRAPLAEIFQLAAQYGAEVIVDEAHATGVCGPAGRGLVFECSFEKQALAVVHSCGKALASMGAFVCGSKTLKRILINSARTLIFSTALPSYVAAQVGAAAQLAHSMDEERNHLSSLAANLCARLRTFGIDCGPTSSHIVPLIVGSNEAALHLASELEENGFSSRAIRSPSVPPGTERVRISLTASLTMDEVERFADAVASSYAAGVARD